MRTRVIAVLLGLVLVLATTACEPLPPWWPTARATPELQQRHYKEPLVGDFDADGIDDIFWYAPDESTLDPTEEMWRGLPDGGFARSAGPSVHGSYRATVLDLTGDGGDDIFWYAPRGRSTIWRMGPSGVEAQARFLMPERVDEIQVIDNDEGTDDMVLLGSQLDGNPAWWDTDGAPFGTPSLHFGGSWPGAQHAIPVSGDFDGDGRGDVLLHGPGPELDAVWWSQPDGTIKGQRMTGITGTYRPRAFDGDGDGRDDLAFFTWGSTTASVWLGQPEGWFRRTTQPVPRRFSGWLVQRAHTEGGHDAVLLVHDDEVQIEAWTLGPDGRAVSRPVEPFPFRAWPLLGRFAAGSIRDDVYLYDAVGRDTLYLSPRATA